MGKGIVYKEIKDLFEARDRAVAGRDKELLKSTQLDSSRVYVPRGKNFVTEIINVVDEDDEGIQKVVFVKERYSYKDYGENDEVFEATEVRFRIYHLINTAFG